MEKFNTATVYRNGFCCGVWALPANINLSDQKKLEIKEQVSEKQKLLQAKFSVIFGIIQNDIYMGCGSINVFASGILNSIT